MEVTDAVCYKGGYKRGSVLFPDEISTGNKEPIHLDLDLMATDITCSHVDWDDWSSGTDTCALYMRDDPCTDFKKFSSCSKSVDQVRFGPWIASDSAGHECCKQQPICCAGASKWSQSGFYSDVGISVNTTMWIDGIEGHQFWQASGISVEGSPQDLYYKRTQSLPLPFPDDEFVVPNLCQNSQTSAQSNLATVSIYNFEQKEPPCCQS